MADVIYYGSWMCPFCQRVHFALDQRGIDYEEIDVPVSKIRPDDYEFPPEFIEHSPKKEVPMVKVGDDYLVDSLPILEELEKRFAQNPLIPADAADEAWRWVKFVDDEIVKNSGKAYMAPEASDREAAVRGLKSALEELNAHLEGREWIVGKQPTMAEALIAALYQRWDAMQRTGLAVGQLPPQVKMHRERVELLPGYKNLKWNSDQEDIFARVFAVD